MHKNIWQTLEHGIKYKEQNYNASCFAAAFQNLEANMTYWRCLGRNNQYCYYEDLLDEFHKTKTRKSLDDSAPLVEEIELFFEQHINGRLTHLEFKYETPYENIIMNLSGVYNKALIFVPMIIGNNGHASAFFCKRIGGVDHYVCLTTMTNYKNADEELYVFPCDRKYEIFDKFPAMESFKTLGSATVVHQNPDTTNRSKPNVKIVLVSFT